MGGNNNTYIKGLLWRLNKLTFVKYLEQYLANDTCSKDSAKCSYIISIDSLGVFPPWAFHTHMSTNFSKVQVINNLKDFLILGELAFNER